METKELDNEYVAHSYGRFNTALSKGKGSTVYDENGKEYVFIDRVSYYVEELINNAYLKTLPLYKALDKEIPDNLPFSASMLPGNVGSRTHAD